MKRELPPVTCAVPPKLKWDYNASTGSSIANIGPATRIVRYRAGGLYRAEYWGDYSLDFPIGSNASTPKKALRNLCENVRKRNLK